MISLSQAVSGSIIQEIAEIRSVVKKHLLQNADFYFGAASYIALIGMIYFTGLPPALCLWKRFILVVATTVLCTFVYGLFHHKTVQYMQRAHPAEYGQLLAWKNERADDSRSKKERGQFIADLSYAIYAEMPRMHIKHSNLPPILPNLPHVQTLVLTGPIDDQAINNLMPHLPSLNCVLLATAQKPDNMDGTVNAFRPFMKPNSKLCIAFPPNLGIPAIEPTAYQYTGIEAEPYKQVNPSNSDLHELKRAIIGI